MTAGPVDKNLGRLTVCQYDECEILEDLSRHESGERKVHGVLNEQNLEMYNDLVFWARTKAGDASR